METNLKEQKISLRVLLRICLIFGQFQPGVAYNSVAYKKKHVIHIPFFGIVNLLCCGGSFSNITFIDAKTKYRTLYFLDVSWPHL